VGAPDPPYFELPQAVIEPSDLRAASNGGSDAPTDSGYTKIYSTDSAFAALKSDGSITAWGNLTHGGSGEPTDSGYTKIYPTYHAFAALKSDGSITAWGNSKYGGSGARQWVHLSLHELSYPKP
jgi:hypothetical protein